MNPNMANWSLATHLQAAVRSTKHVTADRSKSISSNFANMAFWRYRPYSVAIALPGRLDVDHETGVGVSRNITFWASSEPIRLFLDGSDGDRETSVMGVARQIKIS